MAENFATKFYRSQTEIRELKEKLALTEAKLVSLQNVLAPAVDEFEQMQKRFRIETECRSEAEKYAMKMRKQNVQLKRQSMEILGKMQSLSIVDFDDIDGTSAMSSSVVDTADGEPETRDVLNSKISTLEELVRDLESKIEIAELEKQTAYEREVHLKAMIDGLEDQLKDSQQQIADHYNNMKSLKRVSSAAWQEYEELRANYERELMLKGEAENFAHQMMSERDAVRRQSDVLLESATADERLHSALLKIEDLTKQLSQQRHEYQQEIETLRNEVDSSLLARQMEQYDSKLQLAVDENSRLQRTIKDLEKWKAKLEKENYDLVNKLDVAEQKLKPPAPPPPPPPPPPNFFSPLKLLVTKKKPTSSSNAPSKEKGDPRDQTYEQALKEMMERIKTGKSLKSASETKITDNSKSAMGNLQQFMSAKRLQSVPDDTSDIDARIRRHKEQAAVASLGQSETELTRRFQRLASSSKDRPS